MVVGAEATMKSIPAESAKAWHKFLDEIDSATQKLSGGATDCVWYRGHTRFNYPLLPSLFRGFEYPNQKASWKRIWSLESDLFWEFSARARELHAKLRSDWDYLFAMQHYRTPTRLLDWTEVLGVAVYFATLNVDESPGTKSNAAENLMPCVWVLNPYKLNQVSTGRKHADLYSPENLGWDPREKEYYTYGELLLEGGIDFDWPLAIYPRQNNPRIHDQRAWFTIHGNQFIALEKAPKSKSYLAKVALPFEAIPAARRFLEQAGIDHYLLFADLDNLSRHLREKNGLAATRYGHIS
jgi:hypothetical protein